MILKAKYDQQEDRMRLSMHSSKEMPYYFWMTRCQVVNLIHELMKLSKTGIKEENFPRPVSKIQGIIDVSLIASAATVRSFRLSKVIKGVRLMFITDTESVAITLQDDGLSQFRQMLSQQAERSGWDVDAALVRLNAEKQAQTLIRKISSSSDQF